jgi:hypothetical protein
MAKLEVYVRSLELSTLQFVDKEGAMHACAQAGKTAFQGLGRVSNLLGNRYLCDDDRTALALVDEYCRHNGLEYEVKDLGAMSFLQKLELRMKGIKALAVCYEEKMVHGVPTEDSLRRLTAA